MRGMTGGLVGANQSHVTAGQPVNVAVAAFVRHLHGARFDHALSTFGTPGAVGPYDIQVTLERVARLLAGEAVSWALTGGIACGLYGFPRTVRDIDLLTAESALAPEALARELLLGDALPEGRSLLDPHTLVRVDLLKVQAGFSVADLIARSRPITLAEGLALPVLTAEDLLLTRLWQYHATGEFADDQWNDLMGVVKIQAPYLDAGYLATQAHAHDLDALWCQLCIDTEFGAQSHAADEHSGSAAPGTPGH
ncbi:MAG TPA: hypothetical protein VGR57_06750 [Ktedonobacterales bacterium]|nr:hypothetical protein [Ktedonobacterales bacterium]